MSTVVVSSSGGSHTTYFAVVMNQPPAALAESSNEFTANLVPRLWPFDTCHMTVTVTRKIVLPVT